MPETDCISEDQLGGLINNDNVETTQLLWRVVDYQALKLGTKYWKTVPEEVLETTLEGILTTFPSCKLSSEKQARYRPIIKRLLDERLQIHQKAAPFWHLQS